MYHLKSAVKPDEINKEYLPKCMYQLKRLAEIDIEPLHRDTLWSLEQRQDKLLTQLEELRCLLLKKATVILEPLPATVTPHKVQCSLTLAVTASPSDPPSSLLVLLPWLQQQYGVTSSVTCHLHSSLPTCKLSEVFQKESSDPNIKISIIWKDVGPDPVLVVSPMVQLGIRGEVNLVRYIMRLLAFEYASVIDECAADQLLDMSNQLLYSNAKQQRWLLEHVSLQSKSWLLGATMSFVDIMLWNAVQRAKLEKSLPVNIQQWFSECCRQPVFGYAVNFFKSK